MVLWNGALLSCINLSWFLAGMWRSYALKYRNWRVRHYARFYASFHCFGIIYFHLFKSMNVNHRCCSSLSIGRLTYFSVSVNDYLPPMFPELETEEDERPPSVNGDLVRPGSSPCSWTERLLLYLRLSNNVVLSLVGWDYLDLKKKLMRRNERWISRIIFFFFNFGFCTFKSFYLNSGN